MQAMRTMRIPPSYQPFGLGANYGNPDPAASFARGLGNALAMPQQGEPAYAPQPWQPNALSFGGRAPEAPTSNALSFGDRLGQSESGGNYGSVNSLGYSGKYQFGQDRLDDFNRANGTSLTTAELVQSPDVQEQVFQWHVADIDRFIYDNGLDQYGVPLDAMRAVAHLGGKGGLKKYVTSGGKYNPADDYGTSLSDYAKKFG